MRSETAYRRTLRLLYGPMVAWGRVVPARRTPATYGRLQDYTDMAAGITEKAARLHAYLAARLAGADHAKAVVQQNKTAEGIRRVLGYTVPKSDIHF